VQEHNTTSDDSDAEVDDHADDGDNEPDKEPPAPQASQPRTIAQDQPRHNVRKPDRLIEHGYVASKLLQHRRRQKKKWYDACIDRNTLHEEALQAMHWDLLKDAGKGGTLRQLSTCTRLH
jgi:hypothetical protein